MSFRFKLAENVEKGDVLFFNMKKMKVKDYLGSRYPECTDIEHSRVLMENGETIYLPFGIMVQVF